ncbi:MAG: hypothetical protein ACRC1K_25525, partial [Planctomycetia bacterium]
MSETSFTGRKRDRKTRSSVRFADFAAQTLITVGGVGTILAVLGVCVFLFWVAAPLFLSPKVGAPASAAATVGAPDPKTDARVAAFAVDDGEALGWIVRSDGGFQVVDLGSGAASAAAPLVKDAAPTAVAANARQARFALGFADGSIVTGKIGLKNLGVKDADAPAGAAELKAGKSLLDGASVVQRVKDGSLKRFLAVPAVDKPNVKLAGGRKPILVDHVSGQNGTMVVALTDDGVLRFERTRKTKDLVTGKETKTVAAGTVVGYDPAAMKEPPRWLKTTGLADSIYLIWTDGAAR